ncbi:uncharacterized protein LOC134194207 isoform X2 [Corticium candelabrum]|uniref:uncharacterized protein LOC134194207 isoform X2 n=1 Tax=Corticium candelabrum TaxID=121492 RepID=UPI002E25D5FE|nr:uncharacterized protein LOC134194207 isoform X2 [Corticium candelabrum]
MNVVVESVILESAAQESTSRGDQEIADALHQERSELGVGEVDEAGQTVAHQLQQSTQAVEEEIRALAADELPRRATTLRNDVGSYFDGIRHRLFGQTGMRMAGRLCSAAGILIAQYLQFNSGKISLRDLLNCIFGEIVELIVDFIQPQSETNCWVELSSMQTNTNTQGYNL